MGFTDETVRFRLDDSNKVEISETLTAVYRSLEEKRLQSHQSNCWLRIEWGPCLCTSLQ